LKVLGENEFICDEYMDTCMQLQTIRNASGAGLLFSYLAEMAGLVKLGAFVAGQVSN